MMASECQHVARGGQDGISCPIVLVGSALILLVIATVWQRHLLPLASLRQQLYGQILNRPGLLNFMVRPIQKIHPFNSQVRLSFQDNAATEPWTSTATEPHACPIPSSRQEPKVPDGIGMEVRLRPTHPVAPRVHALRKTSPSTPCPPMILFPDGSHIYRPIRPPQTPSSTLETTLLLQRERSGH